ncbi:MAG: InlB B-repeat-containing protein [Bifidobacterium sp.]|nr:InlB B-repeat-containing protein [Bifidobacterium sp.]
MTNMHAWFNSMSSMVSIEGLERIDTSYVTDMWDLFCDCSSLHSVSGITHWNTSRVTAMQGVFWDTPLQSIDLSGWSFSALSGDHRIYVFASQNARFIRLGAGKVIPAGGDRGGWDNSLYQAASWSSEDGLWHNPGTGEIGSASSTQATWYGNPYKLTFDANQGTGAPTTALRGNWPDQPANSLALPTTKPTRANYHFLGWSESSTATTADYQSGGSHPALTEDVTLYAVWKSVPAPTIDKAVAKSDGVHVSVKLDGGTQAGDKINVTDSNSHSVTITPAVSSDGSWEAVLPIPADNVGTGKPVSYTATHTLPTGEESLTSMEFDTTVDVIAPGIEGLTYNADTQTFTGTIWSSGNATAQTGRQTEAGDTVTATWPDGTTTATGISDASGNFTISIPPGAETTGVTVKFKASDTAETHGLDGESNVSDEYKLNLPVSSLPLTGGGPSRTHLTLLFSAVLLMAATSALTRKRLSNR